MACQDNPVNPEFCFFVKSCMEADFVVLCHLHNDIYEINPEYSLERLNAEVEAPILRPLDVKS